MNLIGKFIRFHITVFLILLLLSVTAICQTELIVETSNAQANELSDYSLNFQTTIGDYARINKGQLIVTLPSGFSTETLDSVEIIDDYKHIQYTIKKIENDVLSTRLFLNRDRHHDDDDDDDDDGNGLSNIYPDDTTVMINVSIRLSKIQNPSKSGDYQLSLLGLRDNGKIAIGPLLSEPFTITSASIHSIIVTPSESISLKAGMVQPFSASAFDLYGNKIEETVFQWSLVDCARCIGEFTDSSLFVTRVGEGIAQATADGISGFSGQITVTPGDLSRMTLQIDETQFVGNIINHEAAVILYDTYNNLKTDYDLAAFPIELVLAGNELNRYFLDDNAFQIGGVVRLKAFEIIYQGMSGEVSIYAENGIVSSNVVKVFFNNYDIIDVQNNNGETISSVFADQTTEATLLVQNRGNLKATDSVIVFYYWNSTPDFVYRSAFVPSELGTIDEVPITLPGHSEANIFDELVISTESKFVLQGEVVTTQTHMQLLVEVLDVAQLSFIAESFKPDSIIHQIPFDISFDISAIGLAQTLDSTHFQISLQDRITHTTIADLFEGSPEFDVFTEGIISYNNIPAILNENNSYPNGWYDVVIDYQLFSLGNEFTLSEPLVDSIYIIFDNGISLVEGSLNPKIVYAGTNVSFEFKVFVESTVPHVFHEGLSQFKIFDGSFMSSTNLFLDSDSLYPGENTLRSASISIQPEQLGSDLLAEANIKFCLSGMFDTLSFVTSFTEASVPIEVLELPMVQIIDLEVVSPNAPIVNSSQEIQFKATVTNLSLNILDSLDLDLKTIDGNSTILNPIITTYDIQPFDTVSVFFDVIASPSAQSLPESFRVDIYNPMIGVIAPVNNSAFLIIEEEASLDISYRVNGHENVTGFIVSQSDHVLIRFDVENSGTAQVTNGKYQFIVDGISSIKSDTFIGEIVVDSSIEFMFIAPQTDTLLSFNFSVTEYPIDINYNSSAIVLDTFLEFTVLTVSNNAELLIETHLLNSNLVLPGRSKELFELSITNNSNSSLNSIQIEVMDLNIYTPSHDSVEAREVLNIGNTFFSEDGIKVSTTTAGGNELMFWLADFIIEPQQTRTIILESEFKESSYKELVLEMVQSGFKATYIDGPNIGLEVTIKSVNGTDKILSYHIVLKGSSLEESFVIENNPFNPSLNPVQFAYELSEEASIEFQMFTLTGEEVYRSFYQAGSIGASIGENIIQWDGHNNSGDMVLNGVYIASIINKQTGEYARIKVAVVK